MSQISFKEIGLENIVLSTKSPRWEVIPNLEANLVDMVVQESDPTTEAKAIKKIFELEGDLRDFVDLVRGIAQGFRNHELSILVVDQDIDYYVVAEGNRRVLALKLLRRLVELPSFADIKRNYAYDPDDDWDEEYLAAQETVMLENYADLKNIISFEGAIYRKNVINCLVISRKDDDILWEVFFGKHLHNRQLGLRPWGKGKYFVDLLNFFPNGMQPAYEKNDEKKLEARLQRRFSKIKQDYKQAQFVLAVANTDLNDEARARKWMTKQPVAALQTNFCLIPLKKLASYHNYIGQDFKRFIFDFKYRKENYVLEFIEDDKKLVKSNQILSFIKKWFKKDVITTRRNLIKKEYEFTIAFTELIDSSVKDNPFIWQTDQISIKLADTNDSWEKYVLKKLLDIKDKQEAISSYIFSRLKRSKGFWIKTLKNLADQLSYNSRNHLKYLHSSNVTIRSIFEILVVFALFFDSDHLKQVIGWIMKFSRIKFAIQDGQEFTDREKLGVLFLENYAKIMPITWFLTKTFKDKHFSVINGMVTEILTSEKPLSLDQSSYIWNTWNKRILMNEVIHNHFQTLIKRTKKHSPILGQLNIIYDTYKLVADLLNYLDVAKINTINTLMMNVQKSLKNDEIKIISTNVTDN